jgi:hypothetical protein
MGDGASRGAVDRQPPRDHQASEVGSCAPDDDRRGTTMRATARHSGTISLLDSAPRTWSVVGDRAGGVTP